METTNIPAHAALLRDFVNTLSLESADDSLSSPAALSGWLGEHGLGSVRADEAGLTRSRALREAVRRLLLANNGVVPAAAEDWAFVEEAARRGRVVLRFDGDGVLAPAATAAGLDGALGRLAVAVASSTQDGSWSRLKACRAHDCHWAFYDEARNRSRQWCSMTVCGNRDKVRSFRARRASA